MMRERYCYREVLPFIAMVAIECSNVGVNILFKAATQKGLGYYAFIAYSYLISVLFLLLPLPFVFRWSRGLPQLNLSLIFRIFLLGVIGVAAQLCGYKGLNYTSPTLASALSNLIPAFTFILAVIFRMEKVALRSSSTQAKILGSSVSILGALIVLLYKGSIILSTSSPTLSPTPLSPMGSTSQTNWVLGGSLLAIEYLLVPIWYIVQGFFCTGLSSLVHTWGIHLKGPVYVSIFKPLSIVVAAVSSVIFLGDALYFGTVVGAVILSFGFYAVIWGNAKQDELSEDFDMRPSSSSKSPLLLSYKGKDNEETTHC
ncbi:WAT1-related protein At5g40240 isoform X2 [Vigna angularis]|uniref:WAT1-related protein At5g40240 isoform X2 n=1 Tax=Phaseolus angularis TaxID=3914 RepID=UPI000809A0E9|nr:WAT1-related protein At5g40240 isoform X2 [Vigna angularis]